MSISTSLEKLTNGEYNKPHDSHIFEILSFLREIISESKYNFKSFVKQWVEDTHGWRGRGRQKQLLERDAEVGSAFHWKSTALTSISVANAAGVVGCGSFLTNAKDLHAAAIAIQNPFLCFLGGVILSSALPFALWRIAVVRIEQHDAFLFDSSEHNQGAASATASSASVVWSMVAFYAMLAALFCFVSGALTVGQTVMMLATEHSKP